MDTFVVQLKETRQAASLPESTLRFPLEYCHRPAGVFRYYRVRILAQFLERWNKFFVAAVPHGNHRVPPQPGKLGAPHWRSAKDFTEFFRLHFGQPTAGLTRPSRASNSAAEVTGAFRFHGQTS